MNSLEAKKIEMIPISSITVVNPRVRSRRSFREMADNIRAVGLKQPVTVARRQEGEAVCYDLMCGQGRLEAYQIWGQTEIPAIVEDADLEDCMLKSLVENLARRKHSAVDQFQDIAAMKLRGYKDSEIAAKTGLNGHYVRDIVRLMEKGEQRLLKAVLSGQIPITIAMEIAEADDVGVQGALRQAYEKKVLRGRKFLIVKNLIEQRRRSGKTGARAPRLAAPRSTTELIRTYRQDADKKRLLIRKAGATRDKLAFVTAALRQLLDEGQFVDVLRKERLETLPRNIALRLQSKKGSPP